MEDIHSKFELGKKLVATVSENGSNFVKAFKEFSTDTAMGTLHQDEENEDDLEELDFLAITNNLSYDLPKHVGCASHSLNLIATTDVKNAIQKNTTLRTKHTNSIAKCTTLWKMAGRPKTAEVIHEVLGHTLNYPGVTRWNSFYDSISQIRKIKEKLPVLTERLNLTSQALEDSEMQYLNEYCLILKPLALPVEIVTLENTAKWPRQHSNRQSFTNSLCY